MGGGERRYTKLKSALASVEPKFSRQTRRFRARSFRWRKSVFDRSSWMSRRDVDATSRLGRLLRLR